MSTTTTETTMTTDTDIDLTRFCEQDRKHGAEWMLDPFTIGEWTYATNGRIAVRVPKRDGVPEAKWPGSLTIPDAFPAVELGYCDTEWASNPTVTRYARCLECDGKGRVGRKPCKTCEGDGTTVCACCEQDRPCPDCSDGYVTPGSLCPVCEGKKDLVRPTHRLVGPDKIPVRERYGRLILTLPNARNGLPATRTSSVPFLFDGGEGRVMPIQNTAEEDTSDDY